VFFRNYYSIWDDDNSQLTLAPKKNGAVTSIPRGSTSTAPTVGPAGVRNITNTYTTGISTPYIALYSLCGALGAEGVVIGVLFGMGVLVLKATRKQEQDNVKLRATYPEPRLDTVKDLVEGLNNGKTGDSQVIIIKLE